MKVGTESATRSAKIALSREYLSQIIQVLQHRRFPQVDSMSDIVSNKKCCSKMVDITSLLIEEAIRNMSNLKPKNEVML